MLATQTIQRIEAYWAGYFGCGTPELRGDGFRVLVRAEPASAWIFSYRDAQIWHVPDGLVSAVNHALTSRARVDDAFHESFIRDVFGGCVERVLGPCPLSYCDAATLRIPAVRCRLLSAVDRGALDRLADACGKDDWDQSGIEPDHPAIAGCFDGQRLVAAASYEIWGGTLAHVCIVSDPAFRGRGFGGAVAACITSEAIHRNLVPQWRTLATNAPSLAVARAVGYQPIAAHFFVGL